MLSFPAIFGIFFMGHAMLSMQHFRSMSQATGSSASPPIDIIIECLVGMMCCIWAILQSSGKFMKIKAAPYAAKRTYESLSYRPNFAIFNHRGRTLAESKKSS
mmetsp:Transcript_28238/g.49690  ORF Transcript_28238/g.49690 Transcript_28238/m.49690 type:complete len:103 (-) Transcript_28238:172-480(-)